MNIPSPGLDQGALCIYLWLLPHVQPSTANLLFAFPWATYRGCQLPFGEKSVPKNSDHLNSLIPAREFKFKIFTQLWQTAVFPIVLPRCGVVNDRRWPPCSCHSLTAGVINNWGKLHSLSSSHWWENVRFSANALRDCDRAVTTLSISLVDVMLALLPKLSIDVVAIFIKCPTLVQPASWKLAHRLENCGVWALMKLVKDKDSSNSHMPGVPSVRNLPRLQDRTIKWSKFSQVHFLSF